LFEIGLDVSENGREGRAGIGVRIGIGSGEEEEARTACTTKFETEKKSHGGRLHQRGFVRVLVPPSD